MQQIDEIRELAVENDRCSQQERQLKKSIQNMIAYRESQEVNPKEKLGASFSWGIFSMAEIVFTILINKVLSFVLTLSSNHWMTQKKFYEAGYRGYRTIQIIMPVGAVLALPIAFLTLFLIKIIWKKKAKKENEKNTRQNEINRTENAAIQAQNQTIAEHNRMIAEQLESLKKQKQEIGRQLRLKNPLYPIEYLTIPVVDFVEKELQSGRAENIDQALVHYEAKAGRGL